MTFSSARKFFLVGLLCPGTVSTVWSVMNQATINCNPPYEYRADSPAYSYYKTVTFTRDMPDTFSFKIKLQAPVPESLPKPPTVSYGLSINCSNPSQAMAWSGTLLTVDKKIGSGALVLSRGKLESGGKPMPLTISNFTAAADGFSFTVKFPRILDYPESQFFLSTSMVSPKEVTGGQQSLSFYPSQSGTLTVGQAYAHPPLNPTPGPTPSLSLSPGPVAAQTPRVPSPPPYRPTPTPQPEVSNPVIYEPGRAPEASVASSYPPGYQLPSARTFTGDYTSIQKIVINRGADTLDLKITLEGNYPDPVPRDTLVRYLLYLDFGGKPNPTNQQTSRFEGRTVMVVQIAPGGDKFQCSENSIKFHNRNFLFKVMDIARSPNGFSLTIRSNAFLEDTPARMGVLAETVARQKTGRPGSEEGPADHIARVWQSQSAVTTAFGASEPTHLIPLPAAAGPIRPGTLGPQQ